MGTFLPIAVLVLHDIPISYWPSWLHQYWFTLLCVSVFLGLIARFAFILYDIITGNVRILLFVVFAVVLFVAMVLIVGEGLYQHSLNRHMADEDYTLDAMLFYLILAFNAFPLVAFFSRKTNVKKEALCLVLTIVLSLIVSLLVTLLIG